MKFEKQIEVRWADVDQNRHVRHSAYYDYGAHIRIACLDQAGYDADRLGEEGIGPILFHEECSFLKEIKSNDIITINLLKGNLHRDGLKFTLHHELFDQAGKKLAHITVKGAWMDLNRRRLTVPPQALREAFENLDAGEAFSYKK
ncbi:MAG: acyl-CoA thioesterase [Flavobacteriales bacterium]|nr:acyl-CoA thioesterase [Flavobacteriales bacterium]